MMYKQVSSGLQGFIILIFHFSGIEESFAEEPVRPSLNEVGYDVKGQEKECDGHQNILEGVDGDHYEYW